MNNTATASRPYRFPPPPTTTNVNPGSSLGTNANSSTPASSSSATSSTMITPIPSSLIPPTSLLWTELEPWMDAEYARQVCALMRWDAVATVPPSSANSSNNNAGYCVLTFGNSASAAVALTHVNSPMGAQMTMPNSARPCRGRYPPAAPTPSTPSRSTPPTPSSSPACIRTHALDLDLNSRSTTTAACHFSCTPNFFLDQQLKWLGSSSDTASANGGISPAPLSPGYSRHVPSATGIAMDAAGLGSVGSGGGEYPKEYSIFVGDLAPETSNSLPQSGARVEERPCAEVYQAVRELQERKDYAGSGKDPVTGVSRGYGFVRFTDEADQQRALIEMHGPYCLSRPMRVSLATAKFKPPPPSELPVSVSAPGGYPGVWLPTSVSGDQHPHQLSPYQPPPPSVSAPIAEHYPNGEPPGYTRKGGLTTSASGPEYFALGPSPNGPLAPNGGGGGGGGNCKPQADEWRHTAQGRAILGNLIGPNGEQLTSTDPYNTTVFVGGLSPLVGEDTLRTFFVPFGEIHYVKVPVGKHCGFVQFVRKADAERAIGKMQGFPVGGSRIRLSWGRSQYKAAQAAAQAAQAALAQQAHHPPPPPTQQMPVLPQQIVPPIPPAAAVASSAAGANGVANGITPAMPDGMTHEQAVALFQKFQMQGFAAFSGPPAGVVNGNGHNGYVPATTPANVNGGYAGANGAGNEQPHRNGGYHASSPNSGGGGVGEGQSNGQQQAQQQQQPHFTDESRKVQEGPFGDAQDAAHEVVTPSRQVPTSSFSPFWPDPHQHGQQQQHQQQQAQQQQQQRQPIGGLYAAAELLGRRRDTYAGMMPYGGAQRGGLGVPTGKSYTTSFFPVQPSIQTSGGSAAVPICGGVGKSAGSPTRGGYAGSPPAFQVIRYQEPRPISRPGSGAACGGGGEQLRVERIVGGELLFDPIHDLNGTLVSLDLDREREREYAWGLKSPTVTESTSTESTSSGGTVQFRMSMESP
ncbi:hypothetical protein R3P38DRAFT_3263850 [Favolaschia claudopus]|uniref:RRM domain-containing protein n=1 Tax=Favolaschia claudopus TaxID=2862362 RepID=A0AAW0C7N7_9AGAR